MPFDVQRLEIPDLVAIRPQVFSDDRGSFLEVFKETEFAAFGLKLAVAQVNESVSRRGTLRGMHYQIDPHAQGKLVRVIAGEALDVAVDIRRGSPTFGRHVAMRLGSRTPTLLWIPAGFAHGFCALEDDTRFVYLHTAEYVPSAERGISAMDPELGIDWPFPARELQASTKDSALPPLAEAEINFRYEVTLDGPARE